MVKVSTKDRRKIYDYLLSEGVFAVRKDNVGSNEILNIKNIECFLVMRSLLSRKYVEEIFNWQWHYYFLKPEGIKYLREYLGYPETLIPNTHKQDVGKIEEEAEQQAVDEERGQERPRGRGGRGNRGGRGGRGGRVEA
jgi:small subunit ribosomal protein S10e